MISSRPRFPDGCIKRELIYNAISCDTLRMDLYTPCDTMAVHPVVIYLHGGSWISGNRHKAFQRYRSYVCNQLIANHIAILTVDYRLVNLSGIHLDDCLRDSHSAIRYCIDNHEILGVDTSRIALWGSSAGSHLAMLCCGKRDSDLDSNFRYIKLIINDFGPSDLCSIWHKAPEWLRRKASPYFYGADGADMEVFDSLSMVYSPISYVEQLMAFPMMISQGGSDMIVNQRQSIAMHDSLPGSTFLLFENLGHGFKDMDDLQRAAYWQEMEKILKNQGFMK
ncbi:MAG: alpha/beta hydrolase [Bacteroidales bacterium]|nr:alpha/beta hydrolase [Bacteroidales bacterium]